MTFSQQAVLLTPGSIDSVAASIPCPDASGSTAIYASLFPQAADIQLIELPLSKHLDASGKIHVIHAADSQDAENKLASEVLFDPSKAPNKQQSAIRGRAYVFYAEAGKDFSVKPDFQALHEVCYDAKLSRMGKQSTAQLVDDAEMAKKYQEKLLQGEDVEMSEEAAVDNEDDDGAWTDEDVEKPREKKEEESDEDVEEDGDDDKEDEDEDSNASYEDESELESDEDEDDKDPRKKALLDAIKSMISKDGKLDLERLGLVEKNGKLVPKDD